MPFKGGPANQCHFQVCLWFFTCRCLSDLEVTYLLKLVEVRSQISIREVEQLFSDR